MSSLKRSKAFTPLKAAATLVALVLGVLLASGALPPRRADALLKRMTLAELARQSEAIVCGEVLELRCYRGRFLEVGELIFTDVTVKVTEVIAGELRAETVTIQVPGGCLGDVEIRCADAPSYERGEKVLLFLRSFNGCCWNTGWSHGKYRLREERDAASGELRQIADGGKGRPLAAPRELAELRREIPLLRQGSSSR